MKYEIGQSVEWFSPDEKWLPGEVRQVYPYYGFHGGELKYEVHGTGKVKFLTITSDRGLRKP